MHEDEHLCEIFVFQIKVSFHCKSSLRQITLLCFRSIFLSRHFKTDKEKAGTFTLRGKTDSDSGTNVAPLVWSRNGECVILFVSYDNVSAALSPINKICNFIYANQLLAELDDPPHPPPPLPDAFLRTQSWRSAWTSTSRPAAWRSAQRRSLSWPPR